VRTAPASLASGDQSGLVWTPKKGDDPKKYSAVLEPLKQADGRAADGPKTASDFVILLVTVEKTRGIVGKDPQLGAPKPNTVTRDITEDKYKAVMESLNKTESFSYSYMWYSDKKAKALNLDSNKALFDAIDQMDKGQDFAGAALSAEQFKKEINRMLAAARGGLGDLKEGQEIGDVPFAMIVPNDFNWKLGGTTIDKGKSLIIKAK
jgi:hypothetical protein